MAGHLDALLAQSRPLDEIIVVNNASTDGTLRLLAERYPQVKVLDLPLNTGVGGGYASGLSFAMEKGPHDWVWLFDQDSVPEPDTIERLLGGLDLVEGSTDDIGILAPLPVHHGSGLAYPGLLWQRGFARPSPALLRQTICFVDAVISSGTLVRRKAVEKVGLPRQDFFIDFVDFEYCLRVRRQGIRVALVCGSVLHHSIGHPRTATFLGLSRTWADHAPWREYYFVRNQTFTIWSYYPDWKSRLYVLRKILRHAAGILLFGRRKRECLRMMFLGFQDGRAGRLGIRFLPNGSEDRGRSPETEVTPA